MCAGRGLPQREESASSLLRRLANRAGRLLWHPAENPATELRLQLLGLYASHLEKSEFRFSRPQESDVTTPYSGESWILRHLCNLGSPFWYHSGCFWVLRQHLDKGPILVPVATVRLPELRADGNGLQTNAPGLRTHELVLVPSLAKAVVEGQVLASPRDIDAPYAFLPLLRGAELLGAVTLYGRRKTRLDSEEAHFLTALSSLLANALARGKEYKRLAAAEEMNRLHACSSLEEIFSEAVQLLCRHLGAAGCMVVFKADPRARTMSVVATAGLDASARALEYSIELGATGLTAARGVTLRIDSVEAHREEFDLSNLGALEAAHGSRIQSWMAVPIGPPGRNHGVIKALNSSQSWFDDDDALLAQEMGSRLELLVERFLALEKSEQAVAQAEEHAARTDHLLQELRETAAKQERDLSSLTHQIQGPLLSIISLLSTLRLEPSGTRRRENLIRTAEALAEDALLLSSGTVAAFASEEGRAAFGDRDRIDAIEALKSLTERLREAHSRSDLTFTFSEDEGFPALQMSRQLFLSVFYSLIHNALKYADRDSEVRIECGFESGRPVFKVKSVGEPIDPAEQEDIFEKFRRGRAIAATGRLHSGQGLGLWVARELITSAGGDLRLALSPDYPRLAVFVVYPPALDQHERS